MASQAPSRSTGRGLDGALEDTLERLIEPAVLAAVGALGVATVAPLLPVALPICGALYAIRTRPWLVKAHPP
jgi:hypothetical protein